MGGFLSASGERDAKPSEDAYAIFAGSINDQSDPGKLSARTQGVDGLKRKLARIDTGEIPDAMWDFSDDQKNRWSHPHTFFMSQPVINRRTARVAIDGCLFERSNTTVHRARCTMAPRSTSAACRLPASSAIASAVRPSGASTCTCAPATSSARTVRVCPRCAMIINGV